MEKIRCGLSMTNSWSDPPIALIGIVVSLPVTAISLAVISWKFGLGLGLATTIAVFALYRFMYLNPGPAPTGRENDYFEYRDEKFARRWAGSRIPMDIFVDAIIAGAVDFKGDLLTTLRKCDAFVSYRPTHVTIRFLLAQFIPGLSSSFYDKATVKRENALAYSKGNDFFAAFLGPSMVYTSGIYNNLEESLEKAQERKMDEICQRLRLKKGSRLLDIGCGWGTLARHAEQKYGAVVTAVTLSSEGAAWCRQKNSELGTKVNVLHMDYRDIPSSEKFDAISCIEMAEHVQPAQWHGFLSQIKNMLTDEGLYVMQVAGLRQGALWRDVTWGLFMSRYIFPGADSSFPLHTYVEKLEQAGFQIHNIRGLQYHLTLNAWYDNFLKNEGAVRSSKYPDSVIRLWKLFLAWSVIAAAEGSAACRMITCHKDLSHFDRSVFATPN